MALTTNPEMALTTWLSPAWLERRRDAGVLALRLFAGAVLIYGTQDNILSAERMNEFVEFLRAHRTPLPEIAARVSVYAQSLCGALILLGAATRWAGVVTAINFIAALLIAHRATPFAANVAPLAMLTCGVFFVFHGAGPLSLDALLERRITASPGGTAPDRR